jgi:hypothetical protein
VSQAATAETATGWGFTITVSNGTAPSINPSPVLAIVDPTQSLANGRLR